MPWNTSPIRAPQSYHLVSTFIALEKGIQQKNETKMRRRDPPSLLLLYAANFKPIKNEGTCAKRGLEGGPSLNMYHPSGKADSTPLPFSRVKYDVTDKKGTSCEENDLYTRLTSMRRVSDDRGIFDEVRGLHNKKGDIVLFLLALKNFLMVTSLDHCQDKKVLESGRGETWRAKKRRCSFSRFVLQSWMKGVSALAKFSGALVGRSGSGV